MNQKRFNIKASDIAQYLESDLIGDSLNIDNVVALSDCKDGCLSFINKSIYQENIELIALYIVNLDKEIDKNSKASYIKVNNPRLAFAKVLSEFFSMKQEGYISFSSNISKTARIDSNVSIGEFCVIGENVLIGSNTRINNNVVIADATSIGSNCYIKSGTVIGEDGFGFDFEDDGTPIKIPHIGKVLIGDHVEIGAKCTVAKGTLSNTVIADHVKIDDQVHIAHNCNIGKRTVIAACAELSGSVTIGEKCWIGPNVSIKQKLNIGNEVLLGIASTVTKNIASKKKIMGFESLELRELIRIKKWMGIK